MAIKTNRIYIFNLLVKILPPSRCNKLKIKLLRWAGVKVGKNVSIFNPTILGPIELIIGDNCWIGHESLIMGMIGSRIEMKEGSKLGTRAILVTGYHDVDIEGNDVGVFGNITLERRSGVDTMAMVCPGNIIGERAHVTACSIVRHNVPPYARVMGSPAKIIGFMATPQEIAEYESRVYPVNERHNVSKLEKDYKRYFSDRANNIIQYLKSQV